MKRWFWRVLLVAAAMAALTVGASAEEIVQDGIRYDGNTVVGPDSLTIARVEIKAEVNGVKITQIAAKAFSGCTNLTSVKIGNNITTIGEEAFSGCSSLTTVEFSDSVRDINANAFFNCGQLNKVVLPEGLTTIKNFVFSGCSGLKEIYLPASVSSIESLAFVGAGTTVLHRYAGATGRLSNLSTVQEIHPAYMGPIGEESLPATCVEQGLLKYEYKCSQDGLGCGEFGITQDRPTPVNPANHPADTAEQKTEIVSIEAVPSTCTTRGYTEETRCFYCNAVLKSRTQLPDLNPDNHEGEIVSIDATDATCTEPGYIAYEEYSICHHNPAGKEKTVDPLQPNPLGHDYGVSNFFTVDLTKLVNDAITLKGYKDCEEFDINLGDRTFQCVRYDDCRSARTISEIFSEDLEVELSGNSNSLHIDLALDGKLGGILGRIGHDWDGEWNYQDPVSVSDPRALDEYVTDDGQKLPQLASCANGGQPEIFAWKSICQLCKQQDDEVKYVSVPWNGMHTYHNENKDTVTMPATCWHEGYKVTYLVCDGDHTMSAVCDHKYHEDCSVDTYQCEYLLHEIENAIEAFKNDIAQTGAINPTAQQNVDNAFAAYKEHLEKHEEADDPSCVVEYEWYSNEDMAGSEDQQNHAGPFTDPVVTKTGADGGAYDCTKGGTWTTTVTCTYCDTVITTKVEELEPKNHDIPIDTEMGIDPTCLEPAKIKYKPGTCKDCGFVADEDTPLMDDMTRGPQGHEWVFDSEEYQEDHCRVVTGEVHCVRWAECGATSGTRTIAIPGKLGHTWSEWTTTKPATATEDGLETRTCTVCYQYDETAIETRKIPATGGPDEPDEPGGPDDPGTDDPGTTTPNPNASYSITVIQSTNGTAYTSRSSATAGTSITITISPNSGYELDMLRVTTATSVVNTSNQGGGRYSFTMPAANVEVRATFSRVTSSSNANWTGSAGNTSQSTAQTVVQSVPKTSAWGQLFSDIPTTHWAAGEINWANQMGYMNGSGGRFNPDGNITHQQMWMVMARLTGTNPSNMADARRWAINGGFADGSAPVAPVSRHQLVTALYRCAHLMGTSNRNTTSLTGFPDSRTVPTVAREPFAWAVANGIIGGNSNGKLDPNGTLTRAQFAVILYRFSQRV